MSPDARWILFTSASGDLVESDTGLPLAATSPQIVNVYLRDRANATTLLVSAAQHGWAGADSDCQPTGMTSDGRRVVFESTARNLVLQEAGDAPQVFVRNVVSNTTVLASISTNGTWANGACRGSMITPDGRFVAFVSEASNLVEDDTNGIADVFVRDLQEGITRLVSAGAAAGAEGAATLYSCERPLITPDGKYVVFYSTATNLAPAPPTATNLGSGHLYLRDLSQTAITCVSEGAPSLVAGLAAATNVQCFNHVISDDGNWVAYQAAEWGATTGALLRFNVTSQTTELIHTNALVPPGDYGEIADLASTPDGQMLAFVAAIDMPERTNATGILV
jgi:Tol biopolymer transport system component